MSARFEDMMTELMRDVFEAQVNPQPILEAEVDDENVETPKVEEYKIVVKSQSKGEKVYTSTHLSSSRSRNVQLLNQAMSDFLQYDTKRAAIRVMIDALLDALA